MNRIVITVVISAAFAAFAIQAVEKTALKGDGIIESTTGGFKFPDGTVQQSAATPLSCTAITYIPYIITKPGVYCLKSNLHTLIASGAAITVQSTSVVIDLNGWQLSNISADADRKSVGIYANNVGDITIRNGYIQSFYMGIHLEAGSPYRASMNHLIEGIHTFRNRRGGFAIDGVNAIIRNNHVSIAGPSSYSESSFGIELHGLGGRVLNNDVSDIYGGNNNSRTHGIHIVSGDGSIVEGNRIHTVYNGYPMGGTTSGIDIKSSDDVLVIGNRITAVGEGISFISSTGKYQDNLTADVTTAFSGGTDLGGNN